MSKIDPATMIAGDPEVVGCALGEGSALLNLRSNIYYSLNTVGTFVWSEIEQPIAFEELCRRTEQEFDVVPERVREDLASLVCRMDEAGLVRCFRE